MRHRYIWFYGFLIFVLVSCVTVNIYFPAAAVQKAADKIVTDVRGKSEEQRSQEESNRGGLLFFKKFKRFCFITEKAYAQINIEISTPAIRALKASLKKRFPKLKPFYDRGNIGENNKGFVDIRNLSGLGLKERSELMRLVQSENKDRKALYKEIMKANKFGPEVLPNIQKIFANSWRKKSRPGWWIQEDNGNWKKK